MRRHRIAALSVLACLAAAASASSTASEEYRAADPSAPPVVRENLLASERFWPYQVDLSAAWKPDGRAEPLPAGTRAVLVRIDGSGAARIDFGRDGRFLVPVEKTDILARANEIRIGEREKRLPNLVHALGPRLVDAASETIRSADVESLLEAEVFLAVFADPGAEGFDAVASALRPLRSRSEVTTLLLPQGTHPDPELRTRLREMDWPVGFLRDEYGEGYARSLRPDGAPLPAVMLMTPEGRVLVDRAWSKAVVNELAAAIDRHVGEVRAAGTIPEAPGVAGLP